jgi:hypothetical protein
MAFGPLDHLRLTWIDLSLDEGDRGFFVSENEQRRRIAFGREHVRHGGTVRLLYATPFAEQEDIEVDVRFSRAPDATDVDDLRGVSAWDLDRRTGRDRTHRDDRRTDMARRDVPGLGALRRQPSTVWRNCSSPRS